MKKTLTEQPLKINKARLTVRFALMFIPTCSFIAAILLSIYIQETATLERVGLARIDALTRDLSKSLADEFDTAISDLTFLSQYHEMTKLLEGDKSDVKDLLGDLALFASLNKRYDQIRLLNSDGMEIVRINYNDCHPVAVAKKDLQSKASRYYFTESIKLNKGEVFISPMDLNTEHGVIEQPLKPILRFGTPVFDKKGNKKGVAIINYRASIMLNITHAIDEQFIGTLELINSDGHWLHSKDSDKEWAFMYPDKKTTSYATENPVSWKQITSSEANRISTPQSLISFKTVRPIPIDSTAEISTLATNSDYHWKLVAEIPAESIRKQANPLKGNLLVLFLIFVLFAAVFSHILASSSERKKVAHDERERLIKELQKAISEIKTLKGFFPICACCKKIRDDSGFWHQVESYVHDQTGADFTHSYCPSCYDKTMKEIDNDIDEMDLKKKD